MPLHSRNFLLIYMCRRYSRNINDVLVHYIIIILISNYVIIIKWTITQKLRNWSPYSTTPIYYIHELPGKTRVIISHLFVRVFRPYALYAFRCGVPVRTPPDARNKDTTVLARVRNHAGRIEVRKKLLERWKKTKNSFALDAWVSAVGGFQGEWVSRLAASHALEKEKTVEIIDRRGVSSGVALVEVAGWCATIVSGCQN